MLLESCDKDRPDSRSFLVNMNTTTVIRADFTRKYLDMGCRVEQSYHDVSLQRRSIVCMNLQQYDDAHSARQTSALVCPSWASWCIEA